MHSLAVGACCVRIAAQVVQLLVCGNCDGVQEETEIVCATTADAFPQPGIERAESAEAESPPNTQLYALRSRVAIGAFPALPGPSSRAQAPARGSLSPGFPPAASGAGPGGGERESVSLAMDLSESQGPIKKRLKVRILLCVRCPGQQVRQ